MLKEVNQAIVQNHISNPLFINGHKFDTGYVLMKSGDPMMSYIYKDGVVRFGTEHYNTDSMDIKKTVQYRVLCSR